jgi:hypothetical protein
MDLLADLTARRNRHDDQLCVLAGPQDAAEIGVLLRDGGDREALHEDPVPRRCRGRPDPVATAGGTAGGTKIFVDR